MSLKYELQNKVATRILFGVFLFSGKQKFSGGRSLSQSSGALRGVILMVRVRKIGRSEYDVGFTRKKRWAFPLSFVG